VLSLEIYKFVFPNYVVVLFYKLFTKSIIVIKIKIYKAFTVLHRTNSRVRVCVFHVNFFQLYT